MHDAALIDLYEAAKQGKWALLLPLFVELPRLAAKAARYVRPSSGWTFLHQAAYFGHEDGARVLIRAGAPLARRSTSGERPVEVATARGHGELAGLLRRAMDTGEGLWAPVDDPEVLPSSSAWGEGHACRAEVELKVGYGGSVVTIPAGAVHYQDSFGRILVGWHGSYGPPSGMDGRTML